MRVLHITDMMHPGSGISQLLLGYSQRLAKENIYFDYLVESCDKSTEREISNLGGHVYIMPRISIGTIKRYMYFLKDFFKRHRYKIVHSHYYQIDIFAMRLAYKCGVIHYISHSHNPNYSDYKLRSIRNWILSLPIKYLATDFCACSQQSGDFLFGKHILNLRRKSLYVLPNSIDYLKFKFDDLTRTHIRSELNIKEERVIGIVGELRPQKNQIFLLKVVKYIADYYDKNIKLIMVGDGGSRGKIENLIDEYGLRKNIIITGFTDRAWEYYNAFDCYVLPSVYEGFGLSVLEAQVNSLRCVCSTEVPNDPIISKHVIKLSLSSSVKEWADTIHSSLSKGRFSDAISESYNVSLQSKNLSNYYRNMLI